MIDGSSIALRLSDRVNTAHNAQHALLLATAIFAKKQAETSTVAMVLKLLGGLQVLTYNAQGQPSQTAQLGANLNLVS